MGFDGSWGGRCPPRLGTEIRSRIGRGIHKSVSREVISRDNLLRTKGPSIAIRIAYSTKLMDRVLKLVALVLIAAIVLLVIAPQLDLVTAAIRTHRAASHLLAVVFAILAAGLLACPIAHATSVERDPLFRSAAILDLNCVRLC